MRHDVAADLGWGHISAEAAVLPMANAPSARVADPVARSERVKVAPVAQAPADSG